MDKYIIDLEYNYDSQIGFTHSESDLSKNTIFCFKYIDHKYDVEKLCGRGIQPKLQKYFIKKIQKISQIDKGTVQSDDKRGFGYENLSVTNLKEIFPVLSTRDVQEVSVFRFGGEGRIIGYYNKNVFHILFIDPKLELYNHGS